MDYEVVLKNMFAYGLETMRMMYYLERISAASTI